MNVIAQQHNANSGLENPRIFDNTSLADFAISKRAFATPYSYDCTLTLCVVGGGLLSIEFKQDNAVIAIMKGSNLGSIGGYTGWGTVSLSVPIEELLGQTADITVELVVTHKSIAHVQFIRDGHILGDCMTSGIGIGKGTGAGQGMFMSYHA